MEELLMIFIYFILVPVILAFIIWGSFKLFIKVIKFIINWILEV